MSERSPSNPGLTGRVDPDQCFCSRDFPRERQRLSESQRTDHGRRKQTEVIVTGMPSSSASSLTLSNGSPSPSILSVESRLGPEDASDGAHVFQENRIVAEDTTGAEATALSCASSSSWSTAAPSASSVSPSIVSSSPNQRIYICLFHMLDCHDSFDDAAQWRTHVVSHFRTHSPPPTARCPLCPILNFVNGIPDPVSSVLSEHESFRDSAVVTVPDQPTAWDRMLDHVATDHFQHGHTLAGSRPDFDLMRYLYRLRIISDAQFKAMQLSPAPSSPAYHRSQDAVRASIGSSDEPYCAPYSRRREERRRSQQRGVSVSGFCCQ